MTRSEPATRDSLLDSAEALFAEHGFGSASVRAITEAAGANIAAINYHFGSKLELVKAVLERRVGPLNTERLRRLEICQSGANPTLDEVVAAFIQPALEMIRDDEDRANMARLLGNVFSQANADLRPVLLDLFGPMIERFVPVLRRLLPDLTKEQIYWRLHFMIGATSFTVGLGNVAQAYSGGVCDPGDADQLGHELIGFVAAGFSYDAEQSRTAR